MKKLIVFASGNGTNFEALVHHFNQPGALAQIKLLVCDQPEAPVLDRAQRLGIPSLVIDFNRFPSKIAAEQALLPQLPQADLVVLAGFMRIIGETLLNAFPNRIINVHPALLPAFPGRTGIHDAFVYGVKITGVTVHYVDSGIDSGKIIAQEPVRVQAGVDEATLEAQIHAVEHALLPAAVDQLILKNLV